jgi:tetratricopeptide (TPR) repeat protein
MRIFLLGIIPFFISLTAVGQKSLSSALINNWKKTDITHNDGSPYYDAETLNVDFDLNIFSADSLELFNNNRLNTLRYRLLPDSTLRISSLHLKVEEVSEIKLVLSSVESEGFDFRLTFTPKHLFDLTYTPEAYKAKNGDIVFTSIPGKLEPQFRNKNMSPMDYIFEKFGFPEYRVGGFIVRFVVTSTGKVTGTKVIASSNNRFNDRLVKAVNETQGMWEPALFKGQKVSVEMEYDYNLGSGDRAMNSVVDSVQYSKMYLDYGLDFIKSGAYRNAATYLKKSIDYNPLNVEAYYKHAEVSFALKRKEEACESLSYLILLEQKKAVPIYESNCK